MKLLDTETVGFIGPVVLIQYRDSERDEHVKLYPVWKHTIRETLDLVESLMDNHLVLYNGTFDSFHLAKLYNTFRLVPSSRQGKEPIVEEIYGLEKKAWDGLCLKPTKVTDLFLLLKETNLQFLNRRKPIIIKKVPEQLVTWLLSQLRQLQLNELLFAKKRDGYSWNVTPAKGFPGFFDFKLIFDPTIAMKAVINWLFNIEMIEYGIPSQHVPPELCSFSNRKNTHSQYKPYGTEWYKYIDHHIKWWDNQGKEYAIQDIVCLDLLINWFLGKASNAKMQPNEMIDITQLDHLNSELSWSVGVCRQKGYSVDLPLIETKLSELKRSNVPTAPRDALFYLMEVAAPDEKIVIRNTNDKTLKALTNFKSPVGKRAKAIINQRHWDKQELMLRRLQDVGRYHPNFNIIGTFSNRMSGSGGINPQGIDRTLRNIFTLGHCVSGGDFEGQELTVAAIFDEQLAADIESGFDIHANAAKWLFPEFFCEECTGQGYFGEEKDKCSSCDGIGITPSEGVTKDQRHTGKNGMVFPILYGAMPDSIYYNTNISLPIIRIAYDKHLTRYPGTKKQREQIEKDYSAITQPEGLGTKVLFSTPKLVIESLFGYKRIFDVENQIIKFLFDIANQVLDNKEKVYRKEEYEQTASGATRSALYAASFSIQSRITRQAGNHIIQATGAELTKRLQIALWNLQPIGITDWKVQPFNVHDEVICPNDCPDLVEETVQATMVELKKTIPLLSISWKKKIKDWSEK